MIPRPNGKGLYIWQIKTPLERLGSAVAVAQDLKAMGIGWVSVKIADGDTVAYNQRKLPDGSYRDDILAPFIKALHDVGILVGGFHYVYGDKPEAEAEFGVARAIAMGCDFYEIDAEKEYKYKNSQAIRYLDRIALLSEDMIVGLSSYRYPELHPEFPWDEFLVYGYRESIVDYYVPQVYWNPPYPPNYGPRPELLKSLDQISKINSSIEIIPDGRAYIGDGYASPGPHPSELNTFMEDVVKYTNDFDYMVLGHFTFWAYDFLFLHEGGAARKQAIADFGDVPIIVPPEPPNDLITLFDDYQKQASKFGVYPPGKALEYLTLGLNGEAGEIAEKAKRFIREDVLELDLEALALELGDVLWYVSELAAHYDYNLSDIATMNIAKLSSRKENGTLKGSGDNR